MLKIVHSKQQQNEGYNWAQEARNINKWVFKNSIGKHYDCKMQLRKPAARFITRQRESCGQPEAERRQETSIR